MISADGTTKALTLAALAVLAIAGAARAEVILATDFTGVDTSASPTAGSITWDTVNGIIAPAPSLTFDAIDGFFSAPDLISVDRNVDNDGPWSTTIDLALDAGTLAIDLTSFSIRTNYTSNSGATQTANRTINLAVAIEGSASGSLGSSDIDHTDPGGGTGTVASIDLSGFRLDNTETYTLTFTASSADGPGVNMNFDDLAIAGDITVPEPGSLVLLGLGGLAVLRRRRRD